MDLKRFVYDISPYCIQKNLFKMHCYGLHKKRYSDDFFNQLEQLNASQWFTEGELVEYQNAKLVKLVRHAYETVPYYHRVMREKKLRPEDFRSINDLYKMPLLSREDVHRFGKELLSTKYKVKDLYSGHTSGTTGSPLSFYWDADMWFMNHVFDWRQKNWAGLDLGDPYAVLLGQPIVSLNKTRPPFWQFNKFDNQFWLSSFHLSAETVSAYLAQLNDVPIEVLEGYPSTLYVFARLLLDVDESYPLKASMTSSETLYDYQKEAIAKAFGCDNFDFYGLAERVIWATECDQHTGKHLNMEYGVTEIVNAQDEVLPRGDLGFLVGTSLHNYGMPFIRYKTSDLSSISRSDCPCGRALPLMGDVTTKAEDLIYTPSGKYISSSILTHPFKPLHNIEMSQIVQEEVNLITIKIVKRSGYCEQDSKNLLDAFTGRVGDDVDVRIEFVDDIPRGKNGKFKWVVSKVDKNSLHKSFFSNDSLYS